MASTTAKKAGLISALCVPALVLIYSAVTNQLGPDPADVLVDETGEWTIRLLILTLFVSPAHALLRDRGFRPLLYRRILGVSTWAYGTLHLSSYCAFLLAWQWADIGAELVERPYIAVGFVAWLLMTPLAATSTDGMVRRLKKRWRSLHQFIYIVAILAAAHVIWQVRSDAGEAIVYSLLIIIALAWRVRRKYSAG